MALIPQSAPRATPAVFLQNQVATMSSREIAHAMLRFADIAETAGSEANHA